MKDEENTGEAAAGAKCPACREPVKPTWKLCPICEASLRQPACPGCGMEVKDNWKLCPECGVRLVCATCGGRWPAGVSECPACRAGQAARVPPVNSWIEPITGMEFILIPAGRFQMGDLFGDGWDNETPVREMHVASFYLGRCPVTQGQWQKVMGTNPAKFAKGPDYPVEQVSWSDLEAFLARLNVTSGGGRRLRLPTEAEWEFAARSGGRRELYAGGDEIEAVAWYAENSRGSTQPVGLKAPNGLGLHDMSGNVWEWCQDIYASDAYSLPAGGRGRSGGETRERVIRGGSWNLDAWSARCSRRFGFPEDYSGPGLGLRLAADSLPA